MMFSHRLQSWFFDTLNTNIKHTHTYIYRAGSCHFGAQGEIRIWNPLLHAHTHQHYIQHTYHHYIHSLHTSTTHIHYTHPPPFHPHYPKTTAFFIYHSFGSGDRNDEHHVQQQFSDKNINFYCCKLISLLKQANQ